METLSARSADREDGDWVTWMSTWHCDWKHKNIYPQDCQVIKRTFLKGQVVLATGLHKSPVLSTPFLGARAAGDQGAAQETSCSLCVLAGTDSCPGCDPDYESVWGSGLSSGDMQISRGGQGWSMLQRLVELSNSTDAMSSQHPMSDQSNTK